MAIEDLTSLIMRCKKERNFTHALSLQDQIHQKDLDAHPSLGSLLISMWVDIGSMCHAHKVFDKLLYKDTYTWNYLIKGYANCGESEHALTIYQKMQRDGSAQVDFHTLVALVKACAYLRDLDRGHKIYLDVFAKGSLEKNIVISSTFVDMYAKCGSLSRAQDLFDKVPSRDVVLWTALIRGYAEHGPAEKALKCLDQMQDEGISPDAATLLCISKACPTIRARGKGLETHGLIVKIGLFENNCVLGSSLVDMYAKFGMLADAHKVFDMISVQDVVSWTSLLAGYAEHGQGEIALCCLEKMQQDGILPNSITFVCGLKACGNMGASSKGLELHAMIIGAGSESNIYVGSALVDMYVKCACLAKAQETFDGLRVRNVVSWNTLLTGYTEHGLDKEALSCFQKMQDEGISPDSVTLVCSLRACSSTGDKNKGRQIYTDIIRKGYETDTITANTVIDLFGKCGSLDEARNVLSKLPTRNVVSWTALISGYIDYKHTEDAFNCLEAMRQDGIYPSAVTFVCSLKACSNSEEVKKGQELHAEIVRFGLEKELLVGNTLIDMYASYGLFPEALEVLEKLPNRDVVTWNALIAASVQHDCNQEGLDCLEQMHCEAVPPDAVTFICSLKACCNMGATEKGRELHAEITKQGSGAEVSIFNTLVGMYAKFGLLLEAKQVFDSLVVKSVVAWNAIIAAYTEQGHGEAALRCFEEMEPQGVSPDFITVVCTIKACGSIGARGRGRELHSYVSFKGLEAEPLVGNTLVFMYAKCGLLATAQKVFNRLVEHNVVSWTALLAGYAQLGEGENVFQIFEGMIREGITPDLMTHGSVLSACSYSGLVDEGQMYFGIMHNDQNSFPSPWHHVCMIDLLGRAGQLEKAVTLTREMPCHPRCLAWHIVLGACRKWGLMDLGNLAFEHALELDEQDAPAYVSISNIYCDAAMLEDANKFEAILMNRPAWNLLELDDPIKGFALSIQR